MTHRNVGYVSLQRLCCVMSSETSIFGVPGATYMLAINLAKLALIELEYSAADCSRRKASTSDSLERGALNIQLPKIMAAKAAVEFAIELIRISSDSPEDAGTPTESGTGSSTLSTPSLSLLSRFPLASPASAERESAR